MNAYMLDIFPFFCSSGRNNVSLVAVISEKISIFAVVLI